MRSTLVASFIASCSARTFPSPTGDTKVNDKHLIDYYNSVKDSTWVAGHNDFFHGMTFDDAKPLLGATLSHIDNHLNETLDDSVYAAIDDASIPDQFDARQKWPNLIHPIRDQQQCGSCWAFSASEVLSDRVAIATGKPSPVLSPEDMVSCDGKDMGCKGGALPNAWNYMTNNGLLNDKCFPYSAGNGDAPQCISKCKDGEPFRRTKAKSSYAIKGAVNMQKEIMTHGPIQVAFMVYKSFMAYKSGVYQKHAWELKAMGGHAVKIVGWGTENGTPYWIVANSWNTIWGLDGFFKIARGKDACGIETLGPPYGGLPAVDSETIVV